jgi:chitinase
VGQSPDKGATVLTIRDQDAYAAALVTAGLDPDWVVLGDYTLNRKIQGSGANFRNINYFKASFSNFPIQNSSMVVPNPKDLITKGLSDLPSLRKDMDNTLLDIMVG